MRSVVNIPNLSNLTVHSHGLALNRYFSGGGPRDPVAYALWMNFVRLVDSSVREYELARNILAGRLTLSESIIASGHYESLITILKRCVEHLKALRGYHATNPSLKSLLPKNTRVLKGSVERKISEMRHAIQHLDERLKKGSFQKGEAICLMPMNDGVALGNLKISYIEIAEWIKELHSLAGNVALYVPTASE